jgi:DNA uptake protein ComE-like DNA-binding protein
MILYSIDGEPRVIPDSLVENFLAKGYRRKAPGSVVATVEPLTVVSTDSSLIPVNSASLKELTALPLISTAIAKKVIAQRPYAAIEDLIAKVGDVDWIALQAQITF